MTFYFVTYEFMESDIGAVAEASAHIAISSTGDVKAAIEQEIQKITRRAKVISYTIDSDEDDAHIIADYFC